MVATLLIVVGLSIVQL
ncbi:hypothetical protein, partial [Glutamicibacter creatinolyticus]